MLLSIVLIIVGIVLLVLGGEVLLRGALGLSTLLRLTPAVIGLTVVAAGTSVPELAVSAAAAWRGSSDIAVANVVGSNIFNIAVILGLCALIRPFAVRGTILTLEYPVLIGVTVVCILFAHNGVIGRAEAAIFVLIYVAFTAAAIYVVRRQGRHAAAGGTDSTPAGETATEADENVAQLPVRPLACIGLLIGGVLLLTVGAQATVTGAVALARLIGWSERLIGLTIISAGTGLPEVVSALVSSLRGRSDVAIGNVIGSNLFNTLMILGLTGLLGPLGVQSQLIAFDLWWMIGITLLLLPFLFTGRRLSRGEGVGLLGVYGLYITLLIVRA